MGAGVVKPDQHGFRIHIHAGNRSNQRMDQQPGLKCEECSSKLTASRKISCKDCGRLFCVPCSMQPIQQCKKCSIVLSGNFSRAQLKEWKPRDLKAILHKHNVNTSKCREKDELIDLIFSFFGCNINRTSTQASGAGDDLLNNSRHDNETDSRHDNETNQSSPRQNTSQNLPDIDTQSTTVNNEPTQQSEDQSNQDTSNMNQSGLNDTNNDEITSPRNDISPRNEISHIKLEDVRSEEHINQLSIKCLKRLLLNNFVDYKGCCERWELQDRVKRLWIDDQKNKQKAEELRKISENPSLMTSEMPSNQEDELCKICMDATIDCVLLECGHMVTCTNCGKRLSECPICRQYVVRSVHIFKA